MKPMLLTVGLACFLRLTCGLKTSQVTTCAPLLNKFSHSEIAVNIGTPAKTMSLVADTGSSNVIVVHCKCPDHTCVELTDCYDEKKSSSGSLTLDEQGRHTQMRMSFGSGDVYVAIASDEVDLAAHKVNMQDSLLMMFDHELDVEMQNFQGIFGLGVPTTSEHIPKNWLLEAGQQRFSMCLNSFETDSGVLRMNPSPQPVALANIGKLHWGLDFRGISVGAASNPVAVCDPANKDQGMVTACGIIPDSGTTLILGDSKQVLDLFAELCDRWSRCSSAYQQAKASGKYERASADLRETLSKWGFPKALMKPLGVDPATQEKQFKRQTFDAILSKCGTWGNAAISQGPEAFANYIDLELPELHFHIADLSGNQQTLKMQGSGYVVGTQMNGQIICFSFIDDIEYMTPTNGPIWIFGTPLFYEYEVHFDTAGGGAMSFSQSASGCGSCTPSGVVEFSAGPGTGPVHGLMRRKNGMIRDLDMKVRMPKINTSLPL
mmetsp:Transcript_57426/g.101925  ORF Transcript_57426/g.101925 Transcript_57426/m.101925 type:complete len:491 (+) Transcript_57426:93-1565(+)